MFDQDEKAKVNRVTRRRMLGTGAVGMGALLAGCSGDDGGGDSDGGNGGGGGSDDPLEALHGWTGGDGAEAAAVIVEMFEERHPEMEHQIEPIGGDANENLNATVARRLANQNPPDAFAGWPGLNMTQYEGVLDNISGIYDANGWEDVMHPRALEACEMNGEYRAVPIGSHRLNNLFYNVDVLDEAGVDPDDIGDWDSFIDALEAVDANTDHLPMTITTIAPWANAQYFAQIMLGTEGQDAYEAWLNGNGDEQALVRALEKEQNIIENYTNEDRSTVSFPEANDKLINGNAAFFTMGNWAAGMYRNAENFEFEEDWGWVAFPGTEDMYVWHLDSFMFPANGPAPEKAEAFAELIGDADLHVEFNNLKGSIPLRTDIDGSRLNAFLDLNVQHLNTLEQFPPTLAHGLAATPEDWDAIREVFANHFMGPFDPEETAAGLMAVFE